MTANNFLLVWTAVGPTFRDRMVQNITQFKQCEKYDILILTDLPQDYRLDPIRNFPNVIIEDLYKHRNMFPEFIVHEVLPAPTESEVDYKNEIINQLTVQQKCYPIHIHRFALNYEHLDKYSHVIMCDCDTIPVHSDEQYELAYNYLINDMPIDSVSSYTGIQHWDKPVIMEFCDDVMRELNIPTNYHSNPLLAFDNPFKVFKFSSVEKARELFRMWNYCLLKLYNGDASTRGHVLPGSWQNTPEPLHAVLFKIGNIKVNTHQPSSDLLRIFKTFTYPEDRWWNGPIGGYHFDFMVDTKKEFIEKNYELLRKFYTEWHQTFTY